MLRIFLAKLCTIFAKKMISVSSNQIADFVVRNCVISILGKQIFINCQSQQDYIFLIRQREKIKAAVNFIKDLNIKSLDWVTIGVAHTETRQSFPLINDPKPNMPIIVLPNNDDLITECLSYGGPCGIVRMSDHKGLFSNEQITFSSNAHPNDWLGKDMSSYWFEEELEQYLTRLSKDQELRNYSYVAKMMDGKTARLTVDARLVNWRGELARIVKTISSELL